MKHTKLLAILLALLLALGAPVAAMAEGGVSYDDGKEHNEDSITSDDIGVKATGSGTKVIVNGTVTVENTDDTELYGIILKDGGSVETTGNTIVNGNDDGYGIDISNSKEGSAIIGGNLSVESNKFAIGVNMNEVDNNYISIDGDLSADSGYSSYALYIWRGENNDFKVAGNLSADTRGSSAYSLYIYNGENNNFEIGGLSANGNWTTGITLYYADKNNITVNGVTDLESKSGDACGIDLDSSYDNNIYLNDSLTVTSDNSYARGVYSYNGSHDNHVEIDGDLTVNSPNDIAYGIDLKGENNFVGVSGTVKATGSSSRAIAVDGKGSEVSVDGDVISEADYGYGIIAREGTTVNVGGTVKAAYGVIARANSNVTVGGIESTSYAIDATGGGTVLVNGDVKYGDCGIETYGDANIDIIGNLIPMDSENAKRGITIYALDYTTTTGSVIVRGTIDGGDGETIYIADYTDKGDFENYIPEIYVHTIESDDGNFISVDGENASESVYKAINYIIDTTDLKHGKITVQGANVMPDGTYYANEDETITINVQVDKGYKLKKVTGGATLEKAADGSYILTVPRGGGITIDAIIKAVKKAQDTTEQDKTDIVLYRDLDILSDRKALQLVRAINGVDVCGDASSYEEANKFEVIDEDIAAMIKDVENSDFSAVTCELKDGVKVVSQALRVDVNEKKDLTLFLDNAPANATILFYDLTTGEWSTMGSFDGDNLAKVTLPGSGFAFAIA